LERTLRLGKTMRFLIALALVALAACAGEAHRIVLAPVAASQDMHTATNPAVSFGAYRTFSFMSADGGGYRMSARSTEVQRRLRPLIADTLTRKGYVAASGKGDIFILFGSGPRDASTTEASELTAGWLPDDEGADFVEGALVIDAFDGSDGNRVWHGAMRANIDPNRIDDELLARSVQNLLSLFPTPKTDP
jgi:hypothetical protein